MRKEGKVFRSLWLEGSKKKGEKILFSRLAYEGKKSLLKFLGGRKGGLEEKKEGFFFGLIAGRHQVQSKETGG